MAAGILRLGMHRAVSEVASFYHRSRGIEIGEEVRLLGLPTITRAERSRIRIGSRSRLVSVTSRTALGVDRRVVIRTLHPGAEVDIGEDVGMSGAVICSAVGVRIGSRTILGADVMIFDTDFHELAYARPRLYSPLPVPQLEHRVSIGTDVFIGARTLVTKGATIGNGSVIGAGSVVTSAIPSGVIAAGNPARVIKAISGDESSSCV